MRSICGALAVCALIASGCGSDDGDERSQAEEDIRAVLIENLTAGGDEEIECAETVTESYVDRLYGDEEDCRELVSEAGEVSAAEPDEIEFEAVDINGTDASVQVAVNGGDLEGIEGGVTMVEDPERGWLFDDFDGDLARSSVLVALRAKGELPEGLVDCIEDELFGDGAEDEQVKDTYINLVRDGDGSEEVVDAAEACAAPQQSNGSSGGGGGNGSGGSGGNSGDGGNSSQGRSEPVDPSDVDRKAFEEDLRDNLLNQQNLPEPVVDCAIKRLRRTLSNANIATIIERTQNGNEPPAEIIRKLNRAGTVCARSESESNSA